MVNTDNKSYLEYAVPQLQLDFFRQQAEQKIHAEGWAAQGRNISVKIDNFVHCWTTEEAFKQILIQHQIWFRYRGLYFGDAQGAGADFTVRFQGREITLGLRSIAPESLIKWKSVPYPDDRFQHEPENIADYHLVCNHQSGLTRFYGLISREDLLSALQRSPRKYSRKNQEYFRLVPLAEFSFEKLIQFLRQLDSIPVECSAAKRRA